MLLKDFLLSFLHVDYIYIYIHCLLLRAFLSHLVPAQEVSILSYPDLDGVVVFLSAFAPASPSSLLDLLLTFLPVV